MVKTSGSCSSILAKVRQGSSALRVDMKKKLAMSLPPPFMVSRGYTPEYPWLGQQHPEPEDAEPNQPGKKRPLLLMQQIQHPASFWKAIFCVACVVGGLALIVYAGQAIIRAPKGQDQRHPRIARGHEHPLPQHAEHAALVRDDPSEMTTSPGTDSDLFIHLAFGKVSVDEVPESEPDVDALPLADEDNVHIVIRLADPVAAGEEAASFVELFSAPAAESDPASANVGRLAEDEPTAVEEVVDDEIEASPKIEDTLKTAKHMLLLMRLANLAGAQRELEERVKITNTLQEAYAKLEAVEDAKRAADEHDETTLEPQSDGPTSFDLLADGHDDGQQDEKAAQDLQQDQPDKDDEELRAILQRYWTHGGQDQPLQDEVPEHDQPEQEVGDDEQLQDIMQWYYLTEVGQPDQQQDQSPEQNQKQPEPMTNEDEQMRRAILQRFWTIGGRDQPEQDPQQDQPQQDDESDEELLHGIVQWFWTHGGKDQPLDDQPEKADDLDGLRDVQPESAVLAARQRAGLSSDEAVAWDQLNEDDKQDALLPHLAARGQHHDENKLEVGENLEVPVEGSVGPSVVDDGTPDPIVSEVQQYQDMLSQRVPLMYQVLQLRRDQTTAVQQEQRATAYLRLLDLHLLQHQQEAAARSAHSRHDQDMQHLAAYARQVRQSQHQPPSAASAQPGLPRPACHHQLPVQLPVRLPV